MCASYGLGGGVYDPEASYDLDPLDERESTLVLSEWLRGRGGKATITSPKTLNLNPIIRVVDGARQLEPAWWWLWADASGPVAYSAFNAKVERLEQSPAWRRPFQHRALIPASWYVEKKQSFELADQGVFGIAAVTNTVVLADGTRRLSYTMVTRAAVGAAASVHPRMPLVLPREMHHEWLDPSRPGDVELVGRAQQGSTEISREMQIVDDSGHRSARGSGTDPGNAPTLF